jgi:hypothetical protein
MFRKNVVLAFLTLRRRSTGRAEHRIGQGCKFAVASLIADVGMSAQSSRGDPRDCPTKNASFGEHGFGSIGGIEKSAQRSRAQRYIPQFSQTQYFGIDH